MNKDSLLREIIKDTERVESDELLEGIQRDLADRRSTLRQMFREGNVRRQPFVELAYTDREQALPIVKYFRGIGCRAHIDCYRRDECADKLPRMAFTPETPYAQRQKFIEQRTVKGVCKCGRIRVSWSQ